MKTLDKAKISAGTRVLLRADFNVSIRNGEVVDDFRVRKALPTLDFLKKKGANVVIISHIENAEGVKGEPTLQPVAETLNKLGFPCEFLGTIEEAARRSLKLGSGFILVENIRNYPGEKANDPIFAAKLAALGDMYVNDAFSVSHRAHASIVGVPKLLPHFAGLQFALEVENISKAFKPSHPFLFILGGAKFDTKLPLVQRFLDKADDIFIGGALANDFFKAKGFEIGRSTVSSSKIDFDGLLSNKKILLPVDVIACGLGAQKIVAPDKVFKNEKMLDAGPKTLAALKGKIGAAKFILWNGPLGNYENGYKEPTRELAHMIAAATKNGAQSIVGGGDTLAAIAELKQKSGQSPEDSFTFVSTGGGAMLDFLAKGTLPGIEALK